MKKIKSVLAMIAMFLLCFGATGWATTEATGDDASLMDLLRPIYEAFAGGHRAYAGALALVAAVALVRRYVGPRVPWLLGDVGGTILALVGAFGAALAASLAGGASISASIAWTAVTIAAGAVGIYNLVKKLLPPIVAKLPSWAQPIFNLILWIVDKPDPVLTAVRAGDDAVAAKPGTGVISITGEPKDVP